MDKLDKEIMRKMDKLDKATKRRMIFIPFTVKFSAIDNGKIENKDTEKDKK